MRAEEFITDAISTPLGQDAEISYKSGKFSSSPTLYSVGNIALKKCQFADELWYGLIDESAVIPNTLIGILQLGKEKDGLWQVRLSQIIEGYKSKGYGSLLYDYAVMNDGLTIISDFQQTDGELGGSRGLWEKLYKQGRFTVCGYNYDTGDIIPLNNATELDKIYTQREDLVWMATPKKLR